MTSKTNSIQKKEEQLGMGLGKANEILRKSILYSLACELNRNHCSHCEKPIDLNTFSIEHIIPWLHNENPLELFFNLDNISFNHLKCNISKARKSFNSQKALRKDQLGMAFGTASYQLKRNLIFSFLNDLDKNKCFVCNNAMTINDYSIEHKINWLDSATPRELFFDLNNIAFSHKSCNYKAARKPQEIVWEEGKAWCWDCTTMKPLADFPPSKLKCRKERCRVCGTSARRNYVRNR